MSFLTKLSGLTRHEYFQTLKKVEGFLPRYVYREREFIIKRELTKIREYFQLNSDFIDNGNKILSVLWETLSITVDKIIAGTVSVLALLSLKLLSPQVTSVCKVLGVTHSAIIYQFKR